ncbi:N-acetylmuramic acid 6-phosphate etherase [soil metagenome]
MSRAGRQPAERVDAPTEARNPRTLDLDRLDTLALLQAINAEDRTVPDAVAQVLPALAEVVDAAAERLAAGGRVHYFGAGTPGRLAVLDATELPPTFSLEPDRVIAHQAGGRAALVTSVEGAEDDAAAGEADAAVVTAADLVIGLTASGRTPYVGGALAVARAAGARTVLVSANPAAPLASLADHHIAVATGAEVVAGSTRMKAGTAQKLVLNAFSTAVMARLGKTYSNLMVDVVASNAKLQGRTLTILLEASDQDEPTCRAALSAAGGEVKTALVMLLAGLPAAAAADALRRADGRVRAALADLDGRNRHGTTATAPRGR